MKKKFLIDFDNTPVDTRKCHSDYVNYTYDIQSVPEEFVNNASIASIIKKHWKDFDISDVEVMEHMGVYFHTSTNWHKNAKPIDEHVCNILTELSKKYELVVATARQDRSEKLVRHLLELHFPLCVIEKIHFVHTRVSHEKFIHIPKRQFVQEVGPNKFVCFVDDSTKEIKNMQDLIPSHLFDAWNLFENVSDIQSRVSSWKTIGELYL